jgi:prophage regulatory protein
MSEKRILKIAEVSALTGVSKTMVYYKIARGEFPRQISLGSGAKASGWRSEEIDAWIDSLPLKPLPSQAVAEEVRIA